MAYPYENRSFPPQWLWFESQATWWSRGDTNESCPCGSSDAAIAVSHWQPSENQNLWSTRSRPVTDRSSWRSEFLINHPGPLVLHSRDISLYRDSWVCNMSLEARSRPWKSSQIRYATAVWSHFSCWNISWMLVSSAASLSASLLTISHAWSLTQILVPRMSRHSPDHSNQAGMIAFRDSGSRWSHQSWSF